MVNSKKSDYIWIRTDPKLKEALQKIAIENGVSLSQCARNILLKAISESKPSESEVTPEDVLKTCKLILEEFLDSDEYKNRQKEIVKETLKEMAR